MMVQYQKSEIYWSMYLSLRPQSVKEVLAFTIFFRLGPI